MNAVQQNEIKKSIVAVTAFAALATGLVATQDAYAAPPKTKATTKKSTVTVRRAKKPVYVKIVGDRRAAQVRADQLYSSAMAEDAARRDTEQLQQQQQENNTGDPGNAFVANNGNVPVPGPYPGQVNAGPAITPTNNFFGGYYGYGSGSFVSPNFGFNGYNAGFYGPSNYVVVPGGFFGGGPGYQIGGGIPGGVSFGFGY